MDRGGRDRQEGEKSGATQKGVEGTHRDLLEDLSGSGISAQGAGDASALEGLVGDRAGAGQRAGGHQRLGTGDGGQKMMTTRRIWNCKQKPAASTPPPEATSRTPGPPGDFFWGAWLTPSRPSQDI